MSFSILVATPTVAFGDLIRNSLEESGRYRVQVVHDETEGQRLLGIGVYTIVILDSDLEDNGMRSLAEQLRGRQPEHKLVLIPPGNNPRHPLMEGLNCDAYLRKPFYLPDLFELVDELAADSFSEPVDVETRLKWLDPADLERLSTAAGARAALVMLADGAAVFGGVLPEGAHGSLLELTGRFWQRPERTDLVRFVRLKGEDQDSLLYLSAVTETGEICLALLYPNTSPLSKVRAQSGQFVRELRELAGNPRAGHAAPSPAPSLAPPAEEPAAEGRELFPENLPEDDLSEEAALKDFNLAELLGSIPSPDPNGKMPSNGVHSTNADWLPEFLAAFQDEADTSSPRVESSAGRNLEPVTGIVQEAEGGDEEPALDAAARVAEDPDWHWVPETEETSAEMPQLDLKGFAGGEIEPDSIFNRPLPPLEEDERADIPGADAPLFSPGSTGHAMELSPATEALKAKPENTPVEPDPGGKPGPGLPILAETPSNVEGPATGLEGSLFEDALAVLTGAKEKGEDESVGNRASPLSSLVDSEAPELDSEGTSQMRYTYVLIPRLSQHYLTRELTERINQWVKELCQGMGWRLVGISLRPDYFQWTVQVFASISPESVVKIVRQRTSDFIFGQFDRLRQENPSGDFWASSYLVVSGMQPISAHLLRDYIVQTRRENLERAPHLTS